MRNIIVLFILTFIVNKGLGQTIVFSDANLKAKLMQSGTPWQPAIAIDFLGNAGAIDADGDGEIQVSEALNIVSLHIDRYYGIIIAPISDLSGLEHFINLKELTCDNNSISVLDPSFYPNIEYLSCRSNFISNLNFTGLNALKAVGCTDNLLTTLDFSNNPNFISLGCGDNAGLNYVNIKNGKENVFFAGFLLDDTWTNTPNLTYVCVDDNEITEFNSYWTMYHPTQNISVNSYCSFSPGGTFYTIQGTSRYDSNTNGCDAVDNPVPFMKINITDGTVSGSMIATLGNYTIPVQAGTHTLTPVLEHLSYFNISPSPATVTFPATASPNIQDFCIAPNGVHNDLEISVLPYFGLRPGFDAYYKIVYKNNGTTTQSGTVNFAFDDGVLDYVSASPTVGSQSVSNLNWNFSNLLPFESREILVTLNANAPTATPPLNLGDIVTSTATITATTDETPADNVFVLNQTVTNSYDPNDKTCLEGNSIVPAKVGDYVHYMIRFENNGTANAQNIAVKDVIDTTKFDIDSLFPISGSHNFTTRINGGVVEFVFQNINLPFATGTNDGYIAFKIKTKLTLTLGNSFSNSANIYFDYNLPIVTNTATTTVANPLVNTDFDFSNYFSLYPNPVKNSLNITNKNNLEISSISIYNTLGQLVQTITNPSIVNDVSGLKVGTYFVKMVTDNGVISSKFVKE